MAEPEDTPRVSLDALVERSGLKRPEIYKRVKDGGLKAEKIDGMLTFSEADTVTLLESIEKTRTEFVEAASGLLRFLSELLPPEARPETPAEDTDETGWSGALAKVLLTAAVAEKATHLHLDPLADEDRILIREAGHLREWTRLHKAVGGRLREKLKADAKAAGTPTARGKLTLAATDEQPALTCFLTCLPSALGEHLHLVIREQQVDHTFEELGYTSEQATCIEALLSGSPGVFLTTGPDDPGDEMHRLTLGAYLARQGRLVVSLERSEGLRDPSLVQIRYGVDEEEVPDFAEVFDAAISTRPDVVLVDKVDSPAQASAIVRGAQSGALVIAHVVAVDLTWGLRRLGALEVPPSQLAPFLVGGLVRRSFRRLCPQCAEGDGETGRKPVGCERCLDGFAGKVNVFGLVRGSADLVDVLANAEPDLKGVTLRGTPDVDLRSGLRAAIAAGKVFCDDTRAIL